MEKKTIFSIIIVFLMASVDILGLSEVAVFLRSVVVYIPNVIVAAVILLAGMLVAGFVAHVVRGSIKAAQFSSANLLAAIAKWSIVIFSLLIALSQLGVATEIIRIVIIGIVAAASLAFGLAFGLGGRSHADDFIGKMRKHLNE